MAKTGQKILIVEDEPDIRKLVNYNLAQERFKVLEAEDGEQGLKIVQRDKPDLVILDLMLPGLSGMELCKILRERSETERLPVLMLTAKAGEADRIVGLEMGADDYLTKPFSPRELLARIRAVLRRRSTEVQQGRPEGVRAYRFDGWELNLNTHRLRSHDGTGVPLSNGEFSLLVVLLQAAQRILTRDQLLDMSRLHSDEVYNRTVDTQIMRLRRKLETDPTNPRYIQTERGSGYIFNVPVETVY